MKCPRCGAKAGAGRFCSQCGAALAPERPPLAEPTVVGAGADGRRASAEDRTLVETPRPGGGSGAGGPAAGAGAGAGVEAVADAGCGCAEPGPGSGGAGGPSSGLAGSVVSGGGGPASAAGVDARIIGRKIGAIRILQRLGAGGMGVVYKGRHENLEKDVAVKVLPESFITDAALLERFRREARAAARVDHPNIVHVYDLGEEEGRAFIIQEFVDGTPLDRLLRERGALPVARALEVARGIAAALAAAHEAGLIHRDIKPSNVMLTRAGEPKVLDFGLAKVAAAGAEAGRLSLTGQVMGTPYYMSPEQCRGTRAIDGRSDLYSLGATLFEMLAGRRPFEADSVHGILLAHLNDPPPDLAAARPGTPEGVRALVARLLAKRPEDRPATAREVVRALEALRAALPGSGAETVDLGPAALAGAAAGGPASASAPALANSIAAGTPRPIVVTPLSPPPGAVSPPPLAPASGPAALEAGAVRGPAGAGASTPVRPSGAYRNPLSLALAHGAALAALLLFLSLAAGVYAARHVEWMRGWVYLGVFPGIAVVTAIFAPRVGAPLAAALFPTGVFTAAFCALVKGEVNETDAMVMVGIETGILLALALVLHGIARWSGGPRPVPLLIGASLALVIGLLVQSVDESPFDRAVGDALISHGRSIEPGDPAGALAAYEEAARRQGRTYRGYGSEDARYLAARLHLANEGPPFDVERGERLLDSLAEGWSWDIAPEARGFAVGYFGATGQLARALKFIPEGTADQMSVGSELDDASLAQLYLALWRAARAHGDEAFASEVHERGTASSPEFRRLAVLERSHERGFPGPKGGAPPVMDPAPPPPHSTRVLKSWEELQKLLRRRRDGAARPDARTPPLVPPPAPEKDEEHEREGGLADPWSPKGK